MSGPRLVGVGVGPGDPELLTLKAVRAIQAADVVFAPTRRGTERGLAIQIVKEIIDTARQSLVPMAFPTAARGGCWSSVADRIVEQLGDHGQGVFLTLGDPFLYGSFGNLTSALRARAPDLEIETVPGVSSVMAAAAAAGAPLVDGNQNLAIVPATGDIGFIERTLLSFDCTVLLKVGPVLRPILRLLERIELLDHAVYVRRCGQPEQQIVTDVRAKALLLSEDYFALLIVHRR
jgi:precorrin-2/cobalt-factor-2 C20-methyltransferase